MSIFEEYGAFKRNMSSDKAVEVVASDLQNVPIREVLQLLLC